MAEAKERQVAADKARKETRNRAIDLITGRRHPKKDNRMTMFAVLAAVIVVVVGGLFVIMRRNPAPAPLASKSSTNSQGAGRRAQKKSSGSVRSQSASPMTGSLIAASPVPRRVRAAAVPRVRSPRAQRVPRNQAQPQSSPRTKKDRSSANARQSKQGSWAVTAISEGTALIGNRAVREGDVIRGRIVREVGADFIHVEYSGATYALRVGDAMP